MIPGRAGQLGRRRAERQSLAGLFCELSRLVDHRVAGITDAEVDERLQRCLWSAGYARSAEGAARNAAAGGGQHPAVPGCQPPPGLRPGMPARRSAPGVATALAVAPVLRHEPGLDLDTMICELYRAHYQPLVRLAGLLLRDPATAEEVVQDAFVAVHGAWPRLRGPDKALSYLRQSVVNRSRSVLRHRAVADKYPPDRPPEAPAAERAALALLERSAVIAALRRLPSRQREVLVLRYYADLSEADVAKAMSISRGAVKSHTARGISALRAALEGTA